jgi:hypothetical protein
MVAARSSSRYYTLLVFGFRGDMQILELLWLVEGNVCNLVVLVIISIDSSPLEYL